jgi:hypothetical protein
MDPTSSLPEDFSHLSVVDLGASPSSEDTPPDVTPTSNPVSPERDVFIDNDDQLLDDEIMETFSAFREFNKEPALHSLLHNIAFGDNRIVTLTPDEAKKLLATEPSIKPVLEAAWKEGSFRKVRQLSALSVIFYPLLMT